MHTWLLRAGSSSCRTEGLSTGTFFYLECDDCPDVCPLLQNEAKLPAAMMGAGAMAGAECEAMVAEQHKGGKVYQASWSSQARHACAVANNLFFFFLFFRISLLRMLVAAKYRSARCSSTHFFNVWHPTASIGAFRSSSTATYTLRTPQFCHACQRGAHLSIEHNPYLPDHTKA